MRRAASTSSGPILAPTARSGAPTSRQERNCGLTGRSCSENPRHVARPRPESGGSPGCSPTSVKITDRHVSVPFLGPAPCGVGPPRCISSPTASSACCRAASHPAPATTRPPPGRTTSRRLTSKPMGCLQRRQAVQQGSVGSAHATGGLRRALSWSLYVRRPLTRPPSPNRCTSRDAWSSPRGPARRCRPGALSGAACRPARSSLVRVGFPSSAPKCLSLHVGAGIEQASRRSNIHLGLWRSCGRVVDQQNVRTEDDWGPRRSRAESMP